jgi:hypothetical protein
MHLEGPWLSTQGKKKAKPKFKSSADAQRSRELDQSWKELQKKWGIEQENKKKKAALSAEPLKYTLSTPADRSTQHIPSLNTGAAVAAKVEPKVYTGKLIKGLSQMHKSNIVPVIDQEHIIDIARMRRG